MKNFEFSKSNICLFFIHGFCSGPEDWDEQTKFFNNIFTVITPVLRGHDGENLSDLPMSIEQLTNDCEKILKKQKEKKFIFVGHSMGTRIAINLASKFEKKTYGLVLVDGSKFADLESFGSVLNHFEKLISNQGYNLLLKNMFKSMFFDKKFENDKKRIIKRAIEIPSKYSLPLRRNVIWFDAHYLKSALNKINTPILMLQSTKLDEKRNRSTIKNDEKIKYIEFISSFSSKVETKIFRNTGHYISIEKPKLMNKIIFEWIKKIIR